MFTEIDPQNELNAILQYVAQTWEGGDSVQVQQSITNLYNEALELTKNTLDPYAFNDFLFQLIEKNDVKSINIEILDEKKSLNWLSIHFNYGYMDLTSFEKNNRKYNAEDFEKLEPIVPKYWEPLNSNYRNREDIEAYMADKPKVQFSGTNFKFETTFEDNVSMEHVMYFAHEQDNKPEVSLAYAVAQQARLVNKNNNAVKMLKEWEPILNSEEDIQLNFNEPLNIALQHFIVHEKVDPKILKILDAKTTKKSRKP